MSMGSLPNLLNNTVWLIPVDKFIVPYPLEKKECSLGHLIFQKNRVLHISMQDTDVLYFSNIQVALAFYSLLLL